MRSVSLRVTALALSAPVVLAFLHVAGGAVTAGDPPVSGAVAIPKSVQLEHDAIHTTLVEATRAPGAVGGAARELAAVLHPHFVREEEIALPPLGLLRLLADGAEIPDAQVSATLAMTDALRSELPGMLEEHGRIRAAVEKLRTAARDEQVAKYEVLADQLALHAQTEEELLYPAAILVGDLLRARK